MSSSSSFFIFLFCLSIHLCSARNFGVFFHEGSAPQILSSGKGSADEGKTNGGDSIVGESHGSATITPKAKQPEAAVSQKIHEGNAEFFSDYSRPRTRPPSNN